MFVSENFNDHRLDFSVAGSQRCLVLDVVDGQGCVDLVLQVDDGVLELGGVVAVVAAQGQVQNGTGGGVKNLSIN